MSLPESEAVRLLQGEFAELIRRSNSNRAVVCNFGPGWVALRDIPENNWAMRELAQMREKK